MFSVENMSAAVEIPALLMGNLLNRKAEGVLGQLELAALAVINRSGDRTSPPSPAPRAAEPTEELVPAHG